jgi:hypothetical protein
MKIKQILGGIILFTLMIGVNNGYSKMPIDSLEQWQNDIKYLAEKLKEIHPRFRNCGLSAEVESIKVNISDQINSLPDAKIVVGIQKFLATVGDGHTLLFPFGMKRGILFRIPLMLWSFDDGMFVIDASEKRFIGQKVIGIGKYPIEEVLRLIQPYISFDNTQQLRWATPFYITLTDFLVTIGAEEDRNNSTIIFENGVKYTFRAEPIDPENLEIKLIPTKNSPAYLIHRDKTFWMEKVQPEILYVAVNAMNDSQQKSLETFGRELREEIKSFNHMILDLRFNNGGEASKADELLKTCIAFDARGGQLIVLIGRMTFSAAQTFATRIDQWTNALFLGEPTGSKPNHYGNERPFKLPFSGIRGTISSGYNQPVTANDVRNSISPEILIQYNSYDYFSGKDPVLEATVKEIMKTQR